MVLNVTLVPVLKEKLRLIGMMRRSEGLSCKALLLTLTEYWSLPGRRNGNYRMKIRSDKSSWIQRIYLDNCCCKTLNAKMTELVSKKG